MAFLETSGRDLCEVGRPAHNGVSNGEQGEAGTRLVRYVKLSLRSLFDRLTRLIRSREHTTGFGVPALWRMNTREIPAFLVHSARISYPADVPTEGLPVFRLYVQNSGRRLCKIGRLAHRWESAAIIE